MSTPVTYVSNIFNVPAYQDTGYAQGTGNLSSYLIALATGSLTLSGGSFPLTADANFGANFGLKSIYYKSRNANVAATGIVRLGSTEIIAWRDNANANDLELTTNASDQLTYNGFVIATATGALDGTTLTLTATSNQMVIGTTNTTTLSFTAPASSRTYTIPDAGGNVQFVMAGGTQTIAGAKTFSTAVTINPTTNQLVLGVTNTTTISATAPASSAIYTIPDVGTSANFVMTAGTQTINGAKTFGSDVSITGGIAASKANIGSTTAIAVTNSDNTSGSSNAASTITSGGSSGGDAITGYAITGATNWTTGIDNSDSDKYKISASSALGTTDILSLTSSTATFLVTLAMSSTKITGLANGSAATDAAAFGQVPTVTNWASYTPTVAGFGTVSNVSFRWKQLGDTVYVSGIFTAGTTAASTASITLPNSFTILYSSSGMSTIQDMIGIWTSSHTGTLGSNNEIGAMITDGATTTTVFFAVSGSTGAILPKANGNGISSNSDYNLVNFWFVHA